MKFWMAICKDCMKETRIPLVPFDYDTMGNREPLEWGPKDEEYWHVGMISCPHMGGPASPDISKCLRAGEQMAIQNGEIIIYDENTKSK